MFSQRHNISPILAKLLNIRNINNEEIEQFLNPKIKDNLPDPFDLKDMKKAVDKTIDIIINKKKIGIIADYDVDGSTSLAILAKFFKSINQNFIYKIPNRLKDGYGPNTKILDDFLNDKIDLLFTLDCGTNSFGILDDKKYKIFDTIVIDHHISDYKLPEVYSIINPNRFDEKNNYKNLAAVGVVYLFILALRKKLRSINYFNKEFKEPNLLYYLDLVALGTVCDVVSLKNYNRIFVNEGIKIIHERNNKGITAIIDNSNINHSPSSTDLGYIIGPQLNAASRIDDSSLSSKILISENLIEIESISRKLFLLNEKRKLIEKTIYEEALILANKEKDKNILIIRGNDWHIGVLGIVASRLVEKFNKPSIVISFNNQYGIGSARSLNFIDLGNMIMLAKNEGLLISGGGHKMAAGIKILNENYQKFVNFLDDKFKDFNSSFFKKTLDLDLILEINEVNNHLLDNIEQLEPFGNDNPEPQFILKNVSIEFSKVIKEKHIIINFKDIDNNNIKGICFNSYDNELGQNLLNHSNKKYDLACSVKKDVYQGKIKPQLIIKDAIILN
tara:strand:- start:447 stop:2126 length:1680 start_codon:yes stop_codon:yes gene_type:complete